MYSLEINPNRQILERQTELLKENDQLQSEITKLSEDYAEYKQKSIDLTKFKQLQLSKEELIRLNSNLKNKLHRLQAIPPISNQLTLELEEKDRKSLDNLLVNLDKLVTTMSTSSKCSPFEGYSQVVANTVKELTDTIEEQERRCQEVEQTLRNLRTNEEKLMFKDRLHDMQSKVDDLQTTGINMKENNEKLTKEIDQLCLKFNAAEAQMKVHLEKREEAQKELKELRRKIHEIEENNLRLKKEMNDDLEEAAKAKKVVKERENEFKKISEEYEKNRQEFVALNKKMMEANIMPSDVC